MQIPALRHSLDGSVKAIGGRPSIDACLERARVLIVEDDQEMRSFLEESLKEEGYAVRTAANTLSALVSLMSAPVDVLVVDWRMPDLDGFALLSSAHRCFPEIPVIFVTGFARPDIERRAREEGAFTFLAKPFRLSVLVAEIERALKGVPPAAGGDGTPSETRGRGTRGGNAAPSGRVRVLFPPCPSCPTSWSTSKRSPSASSAGVSMPSVSGAPSSSARSPRRSPRRRGARSPECGGSASV